jgi:hypothetical protein
MFPILKQIVKIGEMQKDSHIFITNEYLKGEKFILCAEHSDPSPLQKIELGGISQEFGKKILRRFLVRILRLVNLGNLMETPPSQVAQNSQNLDNKYLHSTWIADGTSCCCGRMTE